MTAHTHVVAREWHGDRLFLNSGSCADGRLEYLSIDTKAGRYEVRGEGILAAPDHAAA